MPQYPQTGHTGYKFELSGLFIEINLRFCTGHPKTAQRRNLGIRNQAYRAACVGLR